MLIAACFIAIFTAVLGVASIIAKRNRKEWIKGRVVYLPFWLALFGMICGGILSIPTVLCAIDRDWLFVLFAVVVLSCDCMMLAYLNCVIWYDDKGFLARNFFGVKKECGFAAVEGIRFGKDQRIFFQGHCVVIDEISYGSEDFIAALDSGHKKATGKWIPTYSSSRWKWDPMNGNIDYPWFYFFLWVFMILLCIFILAAMLISMTSETDPDEVRMYSTSFIEYKIDGEELCLYAREDGLSFIIDYYSSYEDHLPEPETLCSGEIYHIGASGKNRYVKSLSDSAGKIYITYALERQVYRDNQKNAIWFMGVFCIAGIVFSCFGIAVARNPDRYSDRVRRLFYKDGVLH